MAKKKNKLIIIINVIAIIVIAAVVGYLVYGKYFQEDQGRKGGENKARNMDIENICANWEEGQTNNEKKQRRDNINSEDRPNKKMSEDFDPEQRESQMQERQELISEICADGEVTDQEKEQYEELSDK